MSNFELNADMLVEQAVQGEKGAFSSLYGAYSDKIFRHVFFRVPERADAEDITQEVFIRAWRAVGRYRAGKVPFVSWLMVITKNLVADFYRGRKNHAILDDTSSTCASDIDIQRDVESRIDADKLRRAISRLDKPRQKVLMMHFIDDMSYSEMSRALGKSEGAIRVAVCRALVDLKSRIDPKILTASNRS